MSKAIDFAPIIEVSRDAARLEQELRNAKRDVQTFEHEGVKYLVNSNNGGLEKLPVYHFNTLNAATLTGIADYVKANPDTTDQHEKLFIHVVGPNEVRLYGPSLGATKERELFVKAAIGDRSGLADKGGKFHTQEAFAVWLLTAFAKQADLDYVRNVIGTLKAEKVAESTDNGFAQMVATKNGVQSGFAEVKNPVVLAPYRSFPEIAPVEQAFLLRLKNDEDGKPPVVALFNADNGGWAVEAVARIKAWLQAELPKTPVIG